MHTHLLFALGACRQQVLDQVLVTGVGSVVKRSCVPLVVLQQRVSLHFDLQCRASISVNTTDLVTSTVTLSMQCPAAANSACGTVADQVERAWLSAAIPGISQSRCHLASPLERCWLSTVPARVPAWPACQSRNGMDAFTEVSHAARSA